MDTIYVDGTGYQLKQFKNFLGGTHLPDYYTFKGIKEGVPPGTKILTFNSIDATNDWQEDEKYVYFPSPQKLITNFEGVNSLRLALRRLVKPIDTSGYKRWRVLSTLAEVQSWYNNIDPNAPLVFDVETQGLGPVFDLLMIGFSSEKDTVVIPRFLMLSSIKSKAKFHVENNMITDLEGAPTDNDRKKVVLILEKLFTTHNVLIAHNAKFDCKVIKLTLGILPVVKHDTMLMHYTLCETRGTQSLKYQTEHYLGLVYEDELLKLKRKKDDYDALPMFPFMEYCAIDNNVTLLLYYMYKDLINEAEDLQSTYDRMMSMHEALLNAELLGVYVNPNSLKETETYTRNQSAYILGLIQEHINEAIAKFKARNPAFVEKSKVLAEVYEGKKPYNPGSWKQTAFILYIIMGFPQPDVRSIKPNSTSEIALNYIASKFYDGEMPYFFELLLLYRQLEKAHSTYAVGLKKASTPKDTMRIIYSSINISGTEVRRLSSSTPNTQNISKPHVTPWGNLIRYTIAPPPGYVIVSVDYSQAELRCLAYLSADEKLLAAFWSGDDFHSATAKNVFGPNFTKANRSLCKNIVFGIVYTGGPGELARRTGVDYNLVKNVYDQIHAVYPGIELFQYTSYNTLVTKGYIQNVWGSRRTLLLKEELMEPHTIGYRMNNRQRRLFKIAAHFPVASMAGEINNRALYEIYKAGLQAFLPVHDEVNVYAREDEAEKVMSQMVDIMQRIPSKLFPEIPWKVDGEIMRGGWANRPIIPDVPITKINYGYGPSKFSLPGEYRWLTYEEVNLEIEKIRAM